MPDKVTLATHELPGGMLLRLSKWPTHPTRPDHHDVYLEYQGQSFHLWGASWWSMQQKKRWIKTKQGEFWIKRNILGQIVGLESNLGYRYAIIP